MSDTPRILAIIQQQRAALLRGDVDTLRRYAAQWRDVESALLDSAELLARQLADARASGNPVSQNKLLQLQRYQDLLRQTRQQIDSYARQLAPQIEVEQQRLWEQGQIDAGEQIASVVGSFNRLPVEATNTIIGTTADGSPLLNMLRANWPDAIAPLTRELVRGVSLGINPRVVARRMAQATQGSLKRMLVLARTEQLRAYREGSREIYQRSGVVQQYKRMAAKNARTCPLCLADDGHIYKVSEPMPIHPNCRCTSIPLIDGYTINTGKTGAEWFAEQSADVQRQMLGPTRHEMYRNGTPLSAFVGKRNDPDWGPMLRANTLGGIGATLQRQQYAPPLHDIQRNGNKWRIGEHEIDITLKGVAKKSWDLQQIGTINGKPLHYMGMGWSGATKAELLEYVDKTIAPALARIPKSHLDNLTGISIHRWREATTLGESGGNKDGGFATFSVIGEKGQQLAAPPHALIHELGHVRSYTLTAAQAEKWARAVGYTGELDDYRKLFWTPFDYRHQYSNIKGPTDYGRVSPTEAWAETYRILHSRELERDQFGITWGDDKHVANRDELLEIMREILSE